MKKNSKKESNHTVLFYTSISRLFRTTLIGHLYEIAQVYPTVLLSEELDAETARIVRNKKLFPKIKEFVMVESPFNGKVIEKNRKIYEIINDTVQRNRPDIVIAPNDMNPIELYLMRAAKKIGAVNIAIQPGLRVKELKKIALFSNLNSAYSKMPRFLPLRIRLFFAKIKKTLGHYFYYWLLPLTVGEKPFLGKSSFISLKGTPGMRDGDYYVVFSKRDHDICVKEGTPIEKLYILSHPLARNIMDMFLKMSTIKRISENKNKNKKILTLMYSTEEAGFRRSDYQLISKEELMESRIKIIRTITEILKDWKIFIKPHPSMASLPELLEKTTKNFESISKQIKIVNPLDPADKYIGMSDVVVGIPPASNTLFTASLQCPEKIIISLDLKNEFLGDNYEDFSDIEYINNEAKLIGTLEAIRDGKYRKKKKAKAKKEPNEFFNTIDMIEYLFNKKNNKYAKTI